MKKNIVMAVCTLLTFFGLSQAFAGEFDGGSGEFDPKPTPVMNEAEIQKKIAQEMAIACSGNLCKIVGTDSSGEGWTVSFNIGYGTGNNNNGTAIYIGDKSSYNPNTDWNAGITVTYKNYTCQSSLRVTPAVYRFVNTYMYNMVNSDGSVKRNFSPADQTVILFYTTMLNKVESCSNNSNIK